MHGIVSPADSDFWARNYPPNGHRCRCAVSAHSARNVSRNKWTVVKSQNEADLMVIHQQLNKGIPKSKIVQPIADPGWRGSFQLGEQGTSQAILEAFRIFPGKKWLSMVAKQPVPPPVVKIYEQEAKKVAGQVPVNTVAAAEERIRTAAAKAGFKIDVSLSGMGVEEARIAAERLEDLIPKFITEMKSVKIKSIKGSTYAQVFSDKWLEYNSRWFGGDTDKLLKQLVHDQKSGWHPVLKSGAEIGHVTTHEFGHTIFNSFWRSYSKGDPRRDFYDEVLRLRNRYKKDLKATGEAFRQKVPYPVKGDTESWVKYGDRTRDWSAQCRDYQRQQGVFISDYALSKKNPYDEFFAEGFTDAIHGVKPSRYSKEIMEITNKYRGSGSGLIKRGTQ
jgi:hypothetical protein